MGCSAATSAASMTDSLRVGWGWMVTQGEGVRNRRGPPFSDGDYDE